MKIAIVCGHFVPEMGYVEVHLANTFYKLGHTVKVITSNKTSLSAQHAAVNTKKEKVNYDIVRLNSWFSYGQIVCANGIEKELNNFAPEKVFVIGLGKVFPKAVFKMKNRTFKLITLLGDNENTYNNTSKSLKRTLLQKLLKTPVYNLAIKKSDCLVGYTPSTKNSVNSFIAEDLQKELSEKYSTTSLGFDEQEFYYSSEKRDALRAELGIGKEGFVMVTATRVTAAKKLEKVIDAIETLVKKGKPFKYVLIGFSDNEYSQQLKDYISSKKLESTVLMLPFIDRKQMVNYYNMADIGLWSQAAISIFEGLGTGLFLLLPQKSNVSHILKVETGSYYAENNLMETLEKSFSTILNTNRAKNAAESKARFSFNTIAKKLIEI
jgi:glycosyltransferase involved in cell wall biosynthesis